MSRWSDRSWLCHFLILLIFGSILFWSMSNWLHASLLQGFTDVGPRPWYLMHESKDYGHQKTVLWTRITDVLRSDDHHNELSPPLQKASTTKTSESMSEVRMKARNTYSSRLSLVERGCSKASISSIVKRGADFWTKRLFQSEEHKFIYCTIAKCGSTTWLAHLAKLNGFDQAYMARGNADLKARKNAYEALKANFSLSNLDDEKLRFVFVRHPFERLVSAFVNKFVQNSPQMDIKELEVDIIRTQRKAASNTSFVGFIRFVELVNHLLLVWEQSDTVPEDINVHFRPQWSICPFCELDFDVIGHLESFDTDTNFVVDSLNLTSIKNEKGLNQRIVPRKPRKLSPTQVLFAAITKSHVRRLYEMYRIDFELFGFNNISFYMDLAKDNEPHN